MIFKIQDLAVFKIDKTRMEIEFTGRTACLACIKPLYQYLALQKEKQLYSSGLTNCYILSSFTS